MLKLKTAAPMQARLLLGCPLGLSLRSTSASASTGSSHRPAVRCHAEVANQSYQGAYGRFTIDEEDEREVFLYRAGINVAAAGKYACMQHRRAMTQ